MAIITLTGPSCAGKSTLEAALQKAGYGRAISHTTRAPRLGEITGNQYHFISVDEFKDAEQRGEFVESVAFGGNFYAMSGASLKSASEKFKHTVIVVDPHGAMQIRDYCNRNKIPCYSVFVDCLPEAQARRWLDRFIQEPFTEKIMQAYTLRLATMLTGEATWRRDANVYGVISRASGHVPYDYTVDTSLHPPAYLAENLMAFIDNNPPQ